MIYQLAVEEIEPDHWVAWVPDLLGCFSFSQSRKFLLRQPSHATFA
jgi:predicted RNase H-like HicB family nuclease